MKNGKPPKDEPIEFEVSCGNVFRDLGLENPEMLLVKSALITEIHAIMDELHLTKAAAAARLGITPNELHALLRGDVEDRYSIRQLASMLHYINEIPSSRNGRPETGTAKVKR